MSAALPLIGTVADDATHCSYCAKLCRYTCPVAEATGRESVTPWGINRVIAAAAAAGAVTGETAAAVYACSGCRACGSACLPGLDLPTHVRAARAEVVAAGLAPPGVQDAAGMPVQPGGALRAGATDGAELIVFPGCASGDGDALAMLLQAAGMAWDVPRTPVCCGARAADVGLADEGAQRLAGARDALASAAAIVVMDPHCARQLALSTGGGQVDARVRTLPEFLAELLPSLPLQAEPAPVVWHDPCWLGRGMGAYDDARTVVRHASGAEAVEPEFTRDRARCSGGGMGFDVIHPEAGELLRASRAEELRAAGAGTLPVVTACPTAAARLAATGLAAFDLAGWLAGRLAQAPHRKEPHA